SLHFSDVAYVSGDFKTRHHDGPVIFSSRKKKMFVTRTNTETTKGGGNTIKRFDIIIYTIKEDGKWDDGVKFPFCSEAYSVGHPAISDDGKRLYFSSDMPGGFGKSDLWDSD
ncbi:UNVERIFIED_CONTAM: PD40 domain-containing protein, partial [Salmonella enterica subsp. enterica serovar Weltevreden]